jgi:hypothetical protein
MASLAHKTRLTSDHHAQPLLGARLERMAVVIGNLSDAEGTNQLAFLASI